MNKISTLNQQFISNLKTHQLITSNKRNLILLILKSTTTKREARNYLEKYQNQVNSSTDTQRDVYVSRFLEKKPNPFGGIYELSGRRLDEIKLRIAIFKISSQDISDWLGIRETLKRLVYLGISPIVILEEGSVGIDFKYEERFMEEEGRRVATGISRGQLESINEDVKTTTIRSLFTLEDNKIQTDLNQILLPLYQHIIPIIQPLIYDASTQYQYFGKSTSLLGEICDTLLLQKRLLSIEKIVMIDKSGGIPSIERNQTSHVFINLSQEYSDIVSELYIGHINPKVRDVHLNNLHTMNKVLSNILRILENDDTTGIITTPEIMSINDDQLNPIIYNVLTDRPIISSSLPSSSTRTPKLSTSIIKKGVDVKVYDEGVYAYHDGFTLENLFKHSIVDKARLVALINDSFGKKLDTERYIDRINLNLATVIILGDYDGAAIITYERGVAYLDKFAIARRNQGLPGLADVIFKIILQSHPKELIWRLRKNNPVNKWYFDRCYGSLTGGNWKIFYTGEVFRGKFGKKNLETYEEICEGIGGSFNE